MIKELKLLLYELKCHINNNCKGAALRTIEKIEAEIIKYYEKTTLYGLRFKE